MRALLQLNVRPNNTDEPRGSRRSRYSARLHQPIPSAIGWWSAATKPIPVDPSLQSALGPDLPAQFGVIVVVLVQNGYLPDSFAAVGYQALVQFVEDAIARLIASLGPNHMTITPADIDSVTAGASCTPGLPSSRADGLAGGQRSLSRCCICGAW